MKKIIALILTLSLVLTIGSVAYAEEASEPSMELSQEELTAKLEAKAAELGMTLDELKVYLQDIKAKMEAKAAEQGVSIDELKSNLRNRLSTKAAEQGLTVEELQEKLKNGGRTRGERKLNGPRRPGSSDEAVDADSIDI